MVLASRLHAVLPRTAQASHPVLPECTRWVPAAGAASEHLLRGDQWVWLLPALAFSPPSMAGTVLSKRASAPVTGLV